MTGAVRPAVQVAVLGRRRLTGAPGGPRRRADARRQRREDRAEPVDDLLLTADHEAEAALEPPDAATRAAVDVVDPALRELGRVPEIVVVVGVAAVDDHVPGLEHLGEGANRLLRDLAGRDHDPDGARLVQLGNEVLERRGSHRSVGDDGRDGLREDVVPDAMVPVTDQPPDDVRTHPAEPDHSELQGGVSGHLSLLAQDLVRVHQRIRGDVRRRRISVRLHV